jgi:hypothetical protein
MANFQVFDLTLKGHLKVSDQRFCLILGDCSVKFELQLESIEWWQML